MKRLFLILIIVPMTVFAQSDPPMGQSLFEKLAAFFDAIPMNGTIIIAITAILEVILRLTKSEKPRSILKFIETLLAILASGLQKLSDLLGKVVPDRLK